MSNAEMDAAVAERVMGSVPCSAWQLQRVTEQGPIYFKLDIGCAHERCHAAGWTPPFSSQLVWAWSVVEHLAREGWSFHVEWKGAGRGFEFTAEGVFTRSGPNGFESRQGAADTVPLLICRLALDVAPNGHKGAEKE